MIYISPKNIIVDFLRVHLTDPRSRAEDSRSETFTATAGQTVFGLTATIGKVQAITSITVDAVSKSKWAIYYPDFRNQKAIFFSGLTGGETVVITYKQGTRSWIFADKRDHSKKAVISFPRMEVKIISGPGQRLGNFEAGIESAMRIQLDIWAKEKDEDQTFTIDDVAYAGEALVDYLSVKAHLAFKDSEGNLHPALYGYAPLQIPQDLPFDVETQSHHKINEFLLKGINIGEM